MQLVRTNDLPARVKKQCPVPQDAGTVTGLFFALASGHDLPYGSKLISADVVQLLKHGSLWIGKAGTNPDWQRVTKISDFPKFKPFGYDDYDSCMSGTAVMPYMPQFFWVPRNWRGKRIFNRSQWGVR